MATERMLIWEGKSELTGDEIIVLATGVPKASSRPNRAVKSGNVKTGDMIQIHILVKGTNPTEAIKLGLDVAICGTCPFKSKASGGNGGCYTHKNLRRGFAQTSTYKAHMSNGSAPFRLEAFEGQRVRFGAYGDPAAVPFEVWEAIAGVAKGVTGYTHQWRYADPRFAKVTRASADSPADRQDARAKGYNTFRVRTSKEGRLPGEIICPASKEAGMKTQCATCMLCGGTDNNRTKDVVIIQH
ncbi:hypothetical protein SEA_DREAMTEAM1_92 [Mycobacterium phage DreamTeam1]|nr:hypothetical protein SEA_DREAMTEAM1_92 [Mycobacterium phage DreamTeam1]